MSLEMIAVRGSPARTARQADQACANTDLPAPLHPLRLTKHNPTPAIIGRFNLIT